MKILEDFLHDDAIKYPEKDAVIFGANSITYSELYIRVCERAKIYADSEFVAVVEKTSPNIDFLVNYFASHLAGKAFLPLEKDVPESRFKELTELLSTFTVKKEIADILLTTGTTGKQKGAMISHQAIIANAENLIESQGYCHDTVFIISGPLNHIGSLSKVWPIIMMGGTILITDGIKDMEQFFSTFRYPSHKFALFLVPASLRMLMEFGGQKLRKFSDKIDFIETGAAPMSQNDMEKLCSFLPHTRLYNTYASTETGIIATYDFSQGECIPGCLGKCMKHSEVLITEEGTIACKGPMIMSGYLADEALTPTVLRDDTVYTADLGSMDEDKKLYLHGRKDDVINVGGLKVSPIEVENIVLAFEGITDCICIGANHPIMGSVLKLIYTTKDGALIDKKKLINFLKLNLELYKIPLLYERSDEIARTYNGKINRKFYN